MTNARPILMMAFISLMLAIRCEAQSQPLQHGHLLSTQARHKLAALITDPALPEISGLTSSRRNNHLLWMNNDSDNGNYLYAVNVKGQLQATYTVDGEKNIDWEDLANFEYKGKPYLLIADTGDNGGLRKDIRLIVLLEPKLEDQSRIIKPAWVIRVRWPDGPRDCEAVSVDPSRNEILLMAKKRVPAQLFSVPVTPRTPSDPIIVAQPVAQTSQIPQPTPEELAQAAPGARYMSQITSMDISRNGRLLVILTYRDAYLFQRKIKESWNQALQHQPKRLDLPPLVQAEAISFSATNKSIWTSTEKNPAPLILTTLP